MKLGKGIVQILAATLVVFGISLAVPGVGSLSLASAPAYAQEEGVHGEQAAPAHEGGMHGEEAGHGEEHEGGSHCSSATVVPIWAVLPFAGILLSIALFPLFASHFWHHKFPQVSLVWGIIGLANYYYLWKIYPCFLIHTGIEYISFIALLGSLFVVSGGILIKGTIKGNPVMNASFLAIGAVIASFIGTTGASMLLIRPLLRANETRKYKVHTIVFFIFLVSNIGGSLTPLGDPPLFLGFLKGVPFTWTFFKMSPVWLFACVILLIVYFSIDVWLFEKEGLKFSAKDFGQSAFVAVKSLIEKIKKNWQVILIAVGIIFVLSSLSLLFGVVEPKISDFQSDVGNLLKAVSQEVESEYNKYLYYRVMLICAAVLGFFCAVIGIVFGALSWKNSERNLKPNKEVAEDNAKAEPVKLIGSHNFLFLGGILGTVILYSRLPVEWGFKRDAIQVGLMTLMAVLSMVTTNKEIREDNGFTWFPIKEVAILFASIFITMIPALQLLAQKGPSMGVTEPWQFFWMTGALSSFLDNAPTYLTFLSLGSSLPVEPGAILVPLLDGTSVSDAILRGIAIGAVFMGANTYIGNGPNFMVKAVAEEAGVKMPSFFGYMGWSVTFLIPLFLLVTFIFFR